MKEGDEKKIEREGGWRRQISNKKNDYREETLASNNKNGKLNNDSDGPQWGFMSFKSSINGVNILTLVESSGI